MCVCMYVYEGERCLYNLHLYMLENSLPGAQHFGLVCLYIAKTKVLSVIGWPYQLKHMSHVSAPDP